MRFAYQNGRGSGYVEAYSAMHAAKKVMGTKATHLCGDSSSEYATYQGQYRDSDDYDQCVVKLVDGECASLFDKAIWTLVSVWMLFCVSALGLMYYDGELFRRIGHSILG